MVSQKLLKDKKEDNFCDEVRSVNEEDTEDRNLRYKSQEI